MSISKPALKDPWASGASGNMANPGGANATGIPYPSGKSIPGRWLNWILNQVDTVGRYLVGRGLPDYDPNERYSVGDRVQWGGGFGRTYVCVVATVGNGTGSNSPGSDASKWAAWGRGIPKYRADGDYEPGDTVIYSDDGNSYQCLLSNFHDSPHAPNSSSIYWKRWGHSDVDIVALIEGNSEIDMSTIGSGISTTSGNVTSVINLKMGFSIIRDLSFVISGASNGYVDITLGSPIAFSGGIQNAQFSPCFTSGSGSGTTGSIVGSPTIAVTGANTCRIYCSRLAGPSWAGYVRLLGY
jgi:hypothetical protein